MPRIVLPRDVRGIVLTMVFGHVAFRPRARRDDDLLLADPSRVCLDMDWSRMAHDGRLFENGAKVKKSLILKKCILEGYPEGSRYSSHQRQLIAEWQRKQAAKRLGRF